MLTASMVFLLLGVADGLSESGREGLVVGAVLAHPPVVLLEVVDFLDGLELLLELVFDVSRQAAVVAVKICFELAHVLLVANLESFTKSVEDHGDVETGESSLEADFVARVFHDQLCLFVLGIGVVELGNCTNDPEGLTVELLLEVMVEQVFQLELVADRHVSEKVSEGGGEVFDSLLGATDELSHLLVDGAVDFRSQLDQESEESQEVDEAANGSYRNVLVLVDHVHNVGDDQFGHDLDHLVPTEILASATLGQERDRFLEEVDHTLLGVDFGDDYGLVLLRIFVKHLLLLLELFELSEVERQPVGELFVGDRSAYLVLGEGAQGKKV